MKIAILGAGAWGTALALSACRSHSANAVTLWARDTAQARAIAAHRQNQRYLSGIDLPDDLQIDTSGMSGLGALVAKQDLVVLASPMVGLRGLLEQLQECPIPVAWLCKGFEAGAASVGEPGLMGHEVQKRVAPTLRAGILSGPSFAQEVAMGRPTALVAASAHASVREALVQAFHSPTLRVYANDDVVGVEVGGAVKNVLAIATGLCDGLHLRLHGRLPLRHGR